MDDGLGAAADSLMSDNCKILTDIGFASELQSASNTRKHDFTQHLLIALFET
jgi:hypothetical protein